MANYLDGNGLKSLWKKITSNYDEVMVFKSGITTYAELSEAILGNKLIVSDVSEGIGLPLPAISAMDTGLTAELYFLDVTDSKLEVLHVTVPENVEETTEETIDLLTANLYTQGRLQPYYDSAKKLIQLAWDGVPMAGGIDASAFIVDGMLSDVNVITVASTDEDLLAAGYSEGDKLIKFTWNVDTDTDDDGEGKVLYLKTTDIAPQTEICYIVSSGSTDSTVSSALRTACLKAAAQRGRLLIALDSGTPTHEAYDIRATGTDDGYQFRLMSTSHAGPTGNPQALLLESYLVTVTHTAYTVEKMYMSFSKSTSGGAVYLNGTGAYSVPASTFLITASDDNVIDRTFAEIKSAIDNEKVILLMGNNMPYVMTRYDAGSAQINIQFACTYLESGCLNMFAASLTVKSDGTVELSEDDTGFFLFNNGDGTKFLSNSGAYKEIRALTDDEIDAAIEAAEEELAAS